MQNDDMTISWEALNAYVDGELSPEAAAKVAAAVAADAAMAARVATLTRLSAVSAKLAAPAKVERRRYRFDWKPMALAASVVAVIAVGGLTWSLLGTSSGSGVNAAVAANEAWLGAGAGMVRTVAMPATSGVLPDLSAAGLRLVYMASLPFGAGEATFAGYEGSHGCHLGLWTAPGSAAAGGGAGQGMAVRQWTAGGAGYVLVGHGMDAQRFERMGELVEQLVRQGRDASPRQRIALEEAGHTGASCQS